MTTNEKLPTGDDDEQVTMPSASCASIPLFICIALSVLSSFSAAFCLSGRPGEPSPAPVHGEMHRNDAVGTDVVRVQVLLISLYIYI